MDRPSETLQGSAWPVLLGTERPGHGLPTGHNNTLGVKAGPLLPHSHLLAVAISHQVATPGQHVAADRKGHRDRQEEPRAPKGRWPIWSGLGSARGPPAPAKAVAGAKGRAGVAHLLGDLQVLLGKSQGLHRAPHGHVGVPQAPACPALAHSAGRETESTSTPPHQAHQPAHSHSEPQPPGGQAPRDRTEEVGGSFSVDQSGAAHDGVELSS